MFVLAALAGAQDNTTKGTDELAGATGKFGQVYTVEDNGTLYNIAVTGAEFSVAPFSMNADNTQAVNVDQKLLVIHYRIKNPNKSDLYVTSWPLFQAVDADNNTIQDSGYSRRDSEKKGFEQTLKPGQGIDDISTYIVVPAQAAIPKLILNRKLANSNSKIIRYDLKTNIVKPIPAPFADPADSSGATALASINATVGTAYTIGFGTLAVDSISLEPGPLGDNDAGDGKQFLVAKITISNGSFAHFYYSDNWFKATVKTEDDKIEDVILLKASQNDAFPGVTLEGGESQAQRVVLAVPKDAKLKTLTIKCDMGNDGISRAFVYDVSGLK
jgi:hypothetical protein